MGPNPTDRGKGGVKRSLLCDANGIPIGCDVAGANRHDIKLFLDTLLSTPIVPPEPTSENPQHLCLDKGYDDRVIFVYVVDWGLVPHIRSRGEEAKSLKDDPTKKARRWVVERLHSWLNRYRGLLIRWEKKVENYVAMLHFAFSLIVFRQPNG